MKLTFFAGNKPFGRVRDKYDGIEIQASELQITDHQGPRVTYRIELKSSLLFPFSLDPPAGFGWGGLTRTFGTLGHPLSPRGKNESANNILDFGHTTPLKRL